MDTNPPPSHRTRAKVAAGLVGLTALAAGVTRWAEAQSPPARSAEPAARLKLPVPIGPADGPIVSRGYAPDYAPLDPARPAAPQGSVQSKARPTGWFTGPQDAPSPLIGSTPAQSVARQAPAPQNRTVFGDALSGMKEFVAGKPAPVPVQPPLPQPVSRVMPPAPPAPGGSGVYAGPPAYRWYGWGTTTPGSNPYAPTGNYPRGSSSWYSQTGATPGAFPVPVNGSRQPVGPEPPAYAGGFDPPATTYQYANPWPPARTAERAPVPTPVSAPPVVAAPLPTLPIPVAPGPSLPTGQPIAQSTTFPPPTPVTFPAAPMPTTPVVPIGPPVPVSVTPPAEPPPTSGGLIWQPVSGPVQSTSAPAPVPQPLPAPAPAGAEWGPPKAAAEPGPNPVFRSQQPGPAPQALTEAVRNACYGWATVHEIKHTAPGKLVIRLVAATEADAHAAAEAVSKIPQLQPYEVGFEAKLGK